MSWKDGYIYKKQEANSSKWSTGTTSEKGLEKRAVIVPIKEW